MTAIIVAQRLREILRSVRRQAAHDNLGPDDDFSRVLALDSLDLGNLVVEIENDFGVALEVSGIADLKSLNRLGAHIASAPGLRLRAHEAHDEIPAFKRASGGEK